MTSCLGLYVESGLIKYAKVTKDNDNIKIDTCGVKAYDDFKEEAAKIIEETMSQKLPISMNLSEEIYNNFDVFTLLSKKDMESAIKTEFEMICADKGLRENVFESRYVLARNLLSKETLKTIYISANKAEIERKSKELEKYKLDTITALPIAISNLLILTNTDNIAILNIEEKATLTLIINGKIHDVLELGTGMKEIYANINAKVNSFSKVYEICKNTNIYNSEGKELLDDPNNEYLVDIMPVLYDISQKSNDILKEYTSQRIEKVYITGSGATIGNVELYFEEYNKSSKYEILKPNFAEKTTKKAQTNIKDYIEVNSAIACALQGLDVGLKQMNFKKKAATTFKELMSMEIGGKSSGGGKKIDFDFNFNLAGTLDKTEKMLVRICITILIAIAAYGVCSNTLLNKIRKTDNEVQMSISKQEAEIAAVEQDIQVVDAKKIEYTNLIQNIETMQNQLSEKIQTINAVPNLLSQIMYVIPKNVQITSIANPSGDSVTINAQSNRYEDLGYFKAKLKTDGILTNVVSTSGEKQDGVVKIEIKGELP